jgi:hypothetical protein
MTHSFTVHVDEIFLSSSLQGVSSLTIPLFATGVVDTGANISANFREKKLNEPNVIIRGLGADDS